MSCQKGHGLGGGSIPKSLPVSHRYWGEALVVGKVGRKFPEPATTRDQAAGRCFGDGLTCTASHSLSTHSRHTSRQRESPGPASA